MYPRGSNGAAQAMIDARTLADWPGRGRRSRWPRSPPTRPPRSAPTARVVRTNREHPAGLSSSVGSKSWWATSRSTISTDYITRAELERLSEEYKRIAGFAREHVT